MSATGRLAFLLAILLDGEKMVVRLISCLCPSMDGTIRAGRRRGSTCHDTAGASWDDATCSHARAAEAPHYSS
ncbi:hypothetical protein E2562_003595 [Oryza meyeriana var. granulata]|uniref:Secreted protein n=1 Tax=Oryza meyeriana var. granulata TaxID=110450 RepID=A0A6G1CNB1_9ORYZ|nr:hypothetical protein E2562_003595 [Oryza meyeriana var. granulata]